MRISIKNGRVLCPSNNIDDKINVFIDDAKIVSLNKKPSGFKSDIDINAKDKIVPVSYTHLTLPTKRIV